MRGPIRLLALLAVSAGVAAGCGGTPGSDNDEADGTPARAKPNVAAAGKVTLTVWDQEVRGGQAAQIKRLNKAFMAKYPNVTIKRVARSFDDLNKTLKLAVSGPEAPDVVQANQGLGVMGQLVKARLIRPVDDYAKIYGWPKRYPRLLLDLNRFQPGGKAFGSGQLYGLSQTGEIVGVFYNRKKVKTPPTTLAEFERQLEEAKAAGDVPIQFGNLDKYPGIHEYESVLARVAPKQLIRDFVFQRNGASFDAPPFGEAATLIQRWAKEDYFTKNFNGVGYDPAWQRFARGQGRFLIAGTWLIADIAERMGDDAGLFLLPGRDAGAAPVALGGEGLPFTITSKSKHPEVGAAYIDFLTDGNAARTLVETGNLPAMSLPAPKPSGALATDVAREWKRLGDADGLVPYLDYTTTTFYDDITAAIQELLGDRQDSSEFTSGLQSKVESSN